MRYLNSISITRSIVLLTVLGLAAVMLYAGVQISSGISSLRAYQNDERLTTIAASISGLTHELQKERGASAGFIASKGSNFAEALPKQRVLSDERIAELRVAVEELKAKSNVSPELDARFEDVLTEIGSLRDLRSRIDALDIQLLDAVGAITSINRNAIGLLPLIGKNIAYSEAANAVQRHSIFMTAKDIVGLERATGATGFALAASGDGTFPPNVAARFNRLLLQQNTLIDTYGEVASNEMRERLKSVLSAPATRAVVEMRDVVASNDPERITAIAPEEWFAAITKMINLIKDLEDAGTEEIFGHMADATGGAKSRLTNSVVVLAVIAVLYGALSGAILRQSSTSLMRTAARVEALAGGDIDTEIHQAPQADLSKITAALEKHRLEAVVRREQQNVQTKLEEASAAGIRRIAKSVSSKDFSERLRLRDLTGSSLILGNGINEILDVADEAFKTQAERDRAELEEKERDANAQREAVAELNEVVSAISNGDFTRKMNTGGLTGVWHDVAEGINRISDTTGAALSDVARIMEGLSKGHLGERMPNTYCGTFAEISEATNTSLDQLKEAFASIDGAVGSIGDVITNLGKGTSELNQRSSEQADTVGQSATSTQTLSERVSQSGATLSKCRDLMATLDERTATGKSVAEEAVHSMSAIETASAEMGKIVATIEEIAFQTNLLSLNASVEAARAGDAGKGFAVVASEVRALASRCAEASKQIGDLITSSVKSVKAGASNVHQTGEAIGEVQETMDVVLTALREITEAGEAQNSEVAKLNASIERLDAMARSNVSLADDNSRLMQTLSDQETSLSATVEMFRDQGGTRSDVPTGASAAA